MSARHKGRKRALDIVYAADLRHHDLADVLVAERHRAADKPEQQSVFDFAAELVQALIDAGEQIDQLISETSTQWPLARMPIVDRSVLRLGTAELLSMPDTPVAVVVSEAAGLAGEYSTDESRGFVQGVLGAIAAKLRDTPLRPGE